MFLSFCSSLANMHSAVVTLDLLNVYGPMQDKGFQASCSVETCSSHSGYHKGMPLTSPLAGLREALLYVI